MIHAHGRGNAALLLAVTAGVFLCGFLPCTEVAAKDLVFQVDSVTVEGCHHWSKERILELVPELSNKSVNVKRLSRQIQIVNDSGAVQLNVDLKKTASESYKAVLDVKENRTDAFAMNVNNTGNSYTGDWRLTTTYSNANLTGRADSLGVAYVTSPGHWEDVKQVAAAYRFLLPKLSSSMYVSYSYSDVDMGTIANFGDIDLSATGKGSTVGLHYQQNLVYTSARKQLLDFGIDHKQYENQQDYRTKNIELLNSGHDFDVTTLSMMYINSVRSTQQAFAYTLGYVTNIHGDRKAYTSYRMGSDETFKIFQAGMMYQYRWTNNWLGNFHINAQYTGDNLLGTEQLGAGGMTSVRGFSERVACGDNGYVGTLEFYTPEVFPHSRFVLFTDFAYLYNNHANLGEIDRTNIASSGIGYRYANEKSGIAVSLDYAKIIDDIDGITQQDERKWHVSVSAKF